MGRSSMVGFRVLFEVLPACNISHMARHPKNADVLLVDVG